MKELKNALTALVKNPSLTGILIAELIFIIPISIFSVLLLQMVIMSSEKSDSMIALGLLFIVAVLWMCVDSFFKAGMFGMAKNVVQDGSTTFREFFPTARRYWIPILLMSVFLYVLMLIPGIPDFITVLQDIPPIPAVTIVLTLIVSVVLLYWMLWVPAIIVFENKNFVESVKVSSARANKESKHTILTAVITVVLIGITYLAAVAISQMQPPNVSLGLALLIAFLGYFILSVGIVLTTLYVFMRYKPKKSRKKSKK